MIYNTFCFIFMLREVKVNLFWPAKNYFVFFIHMNHCLFWQWFISMDGPNNVPYTALCKSYLAMMCMERAAKPHLMRRVYCSCRRFLMFALWKIIVSSYDIRMQQAETIYAPLVTVHLKIITVMFGENSVSILAGDAFESFFKERLRNRPCPRARPIFIFWQYLMHILKSTISQCLTPNLWALATDFLN